MHVIGFNISILGNFGVPVVDFCSLQDAVPQKLFVAINDCLIAYFYGYSQKHNFMSFYE